MRIIVLGVVLLLGACGVQPKTLAGPEGLHVAEVAMDSGSPATALRIATTALAANPRSVPALVTLGQAQYRLKQNSQAMEAFHRALALDPGCEGAQLGLARVQLASDPAAAEATLHKALQRHADNAAMLTDLGIAQDLQGQHAAAQASYHAALAVDPTLVSAQVNLGLSLALAGNAREGVQMLQPLGDSSSSTPRVREDFAVALALAGDERSASAVLESDLTREQTMAALTGVAAFHDPAP